MRIVRPYPLLLIAVLSAQACDSAPSTSPPSSSQRVRVVNANTAPVDVLIDGVVALSNVAPGGVDSVTPSIGEHTVSVRETGSSIMASLQVTAVAARARTVAAVRAGGALSVTALDDTNAIVPSGFTKVRVLHLAPSAGEITVMRTQPDYATPISWQFPFLYSATISAIGNPYYQSTVGKWEVRAWRKPSEDSQGWNGTTARVTLDLKSSEKRTVLVLDKAGGGIVLRVIE